MLTIVPRFEIILTLKLKNSESGKGWKYPFYFVWLNFLRTSSNLTFIYILLSGRKGKETSSKLKGLKKQRPMTYPSILTKTFHPFQILPKDQLLFQSFSRLRLESLQGPSEHLTSLTFLPDSHQRTERICPTIESFSC